MNRKDKKYRRESVQQDLLGDWVVVREWGNANDPADQHVFTKVTRTYREAQDDVKKARKARKVLETSE